MDLAYSWCTQTDQVQWDSSFIMTPSGPFMVTRTSCSDHSLRLQTFHSTSGHFLPHERTVFFITRGSLPAARVDLRRLRGPLPFVPGPFSFSRIPADIFGLLSLACRHFSQQADFYVVADFFTISIMTRANRVDSLGSLNGSCQS